jgi:hypothetical protein
MEGRKPFANCGLVCTLENFQWCGEPCFAGAEILRGRCLALIPGRGKHMSLLISSAFYGKKLTFEYGVDSNKFYEGLGFSLFYVQTPYNPLIKHYTKIFYMFDEGDIPSSQCTMSLRGPKSMRKVDDLGLILIDFYVPALTPRLSSTETSLQLSGNITSLLSVAYAQVYQQRDLCR